MDNNDEVERTEKRVGRDQRAFLTSLSVSTAIILYYIKVEKRMRIRLKLIFYVLAKLWAYGETHLRIIWTTERSIYQSSSTIRIWTESLRAAFDQYRYMYDGELEWPNQVHHLKEVKVYAQS